MQYSPSSLGVGEPVYCPSSANQINANECSSLIFIASDMGTVLVSGADQSHKFHCNLQSPQTNNREKSFQVKVKYCTTSIQVNKYMVYLCQKKVFMLELNLMKNIAF